MKMSSTKEDKVFQDLVAFMDTLTSPSIEGNAPVNATIHSFRLQDIEIWQTVMSCYINTITAEKRVEVIHRLHKGIQSPCRTTRIIGGLFFSELFQHPELLLKSITVDLLMILAGKIHSNDYLEAYFVIKALGNATEGAPKEVEIVKDIVITNFLKRFSGRIKLNISILILQALSKYVRLLKKSRLGSKFDQISNLCADYLRRPNPPIQSCCTELLADLACSYDKMMCGGFKDHVKEFLPDLLLHLHSNDPQIKASTVAALLRLLPYIGYQHVEQLLGANGENISNIYKQLGQKEPDYLLQMLLESIHSLRYKKDLDAVVQHLAMITDALPYTELYGTALRDVWLALKRLTHASGRLREEASNQAVEILSNKWKCLGTVRKASPRKPPMPEPKPPDAQRKTIIIWETSV